jgi:alpha-glucosidase
MTDPTPWWRHAVVYQIYIRSFADSDGDGIGDIAGIRSRLPYLRDLGIDAIWINPWYPSPMIDGGYDVADYRAIDPTFGTMDDALAFIDDVHEHGLRILLDIVPNHTSDQHPWFREALAGPPGSPARARYIFRDGKGRNGDQPPTDWPSVFGGPAWTRVTERDGRPGQWFLHLFAPEQPDLDWSNAEVADEFDSILRFWYERGVDGFRIDVAHGLVKDRAFPDLQGSSPKSQTGTATGRSSARCSCRPLNASRATSGPTSSTRPSTSASSRPAGTLPACGRRSTTTCARWDR